MHLQLRGFGGRPCVCMHLCGVGGWGRRGVLKIDLSRTQTGGIRGKSEAQESIKSTTGHCGGNLSGFFFKR